MVHGFTPALTTTMARPEASLAEKSEHSASHEHLMLVALVQTLWVESCLGSRSMEKPPTANTSHIEPDPERAPIVDTQLPMPWPQDAKYCDICQMWLNGTDQMEHHIPGRKHRKNMRRRHMAAAAGEPQREPSSG